MKPLNYKIAVITGATGGIGIEICKYLLQNNYMVLAACRNNNGRAEKVRKEVEAVTDTVTAERIIFSHLDLSSFGSVDSFTDSVAEYIKENNTGIDLLINNAGIIAPSFGITEDGYETSFQVNYLSAKRLTENLIPYIREHGKIINTVSCTINMRKPYLPAEKSAEQQKKEFGNLKNYGNSKLLLAIYTIQLYLRLDNISVHAADPGIVNTGIITMHRWYDPLADIFFRPFIKSAANGAVPLIKAIEYKNTEQLCKHGHNGLVRYGPPLFRGDKKLSFSGRIIKAAESIILP